LTIGVRRAAQITARAMISSGDTLTSAKSGDALSRLTSSIVRVASTSVHTETCGAEYADCTIADDVALRTPLTAMVSSRPAASGAGVDGATSTGPGVDRAAVGVATEMVSSRTSPHSGVSMLRKTLACDAWRTTSSRVTSPAGPLGATAASSTPRSRASLRIGGFAMMPTDAATRSAAGTAGLRRRDWT
jgi:hypothetical protein